MSTDNSSAIAEAGNALSATLTDILPERWQRFAKFVYTAIVGGLTVTAFVVDGGITTAEWVQIALGALLPGGTAYGATNR